MKDGCQGTDHFIDELPIVALRTHASSAHGAGRKVYKLESHVTLGLLYIQHIQLRFLRLKHGKRSGVSSKGGVTAIAS